MKKKNKNPLDYEVVKQASFNANEVIETKASDVGKSKFISLRDACTCTGNCQPIDPNQIMVHLDQIFYYKLKWMTP